MGWVLRFAGAAVLAASLCACSASDFKQPITAFSVVTKKAAASLGEYEQALDKAGLDANIDFAVGHPAELRPAKNECQQGEKRCRLVLRGKNGESRYLDPGPIDPRIRAIMAAVVEYADNLQTIATADTGAEIKTATDATKANALGLAKAIDAYNAQQKNKVDKLEPSVTKFAGPVSDAFVFVLDKYADAVKLNALRQATSAMDEVFPSFMNLAGQVADAGMTLKRNQLGSAYANADDTYWQAGKPDRAKVVALYNAAQAYDSALNTSPKEMFASLAEAHTKLTKALNNPEVTFDELWPILQKIVEDANKLADIVQAIEKASAAK
jgi:hypothetical protein